MIDQACRGSAGFIGIEFFDENPDAVSAEGSHGTFHLGGRGEGVATLICFTHPI